MRQIFEKVREFMVQVEGLGFDIYIAGGAVRDTILGRMPHDFDLTTSAPIAELKKVARLMSYGGSVEFGTVFALIGGVAVSVTQMKNSAGLCSELNPVTINEDLALRDFTINAMAMNAAGVIFDPFGAKKDIVDQILRTVGRPSEIFEADPVRILRMIRLSTVLNMGIELPTLEAAKLSLDSLAGVSAVRITQELHKILASGDISIRMFQKLYDIGCYPYISEAAREASSVYFSCMLKSIAQEH